MFQYQPRSQNEDNDDTESRGRSETNLLLSLMRLPLVLLVMFLVSIMPLLALLGYGIRGLDKSLGAVREDGCFHIATWVLIVLALAGGICLWNAWPGETPIKPSAVIRPDTPPPAIPQEISTTPPTLTSFPTIPPPPAMTTPLVAHPLFDCAGQPLSQWAAPGTYWYQNGTSLMMMVRDIGTGNSTCPPSVGGRLSDVCDGQVIGESPSDGQASEISTPLGTFPVLIFNRQWQHQGYTGRLDIVNDQEVINAFYACGYGLMRASYSHSGTRNNVSYNDLYEIDLVAFVPKGK